MAEDDKKKPSYNEFPKFPKGKVCQNIFGEAVCDPYKGLDMNLTNFIKEMKPVLDHYLPEEKRKKQFSVLTKVYDYQRRSCPQHVANKLIYLHNSGTMQTDNLIEETLDVKSHTRGLYNFENFNGEDNEDTDFISDSDDYEESNYFYSNEMVGEPQVRPYGNLKDVPVKGRVKIIEDTNESKCLITSFACSIDGDKVAYGCRSLVKPFIEIIKCQSERYSCGHQIINVNYPSIVWTKDSYGFFYSRDSKNYKEGPKIYYFSCLPPPQKSEHTEVINFGPQSYWRTNLSVSENGRYLIIVVSSDKKGNFLYFAKIPKDGLIKGHLMSYQVVNKWKRKYKYVSSIGSHVVFLTDRYAPKGCLIQFSLNFKIPKCHCHWRMIIPEKQFDLLVDAVCVTQNRYFLHYLKPHGFSYIEVQHYKNDSRSFKLDYRYEFRDLFVSEMTSTGNLFVYIKVESCSHPPMILRYEFSSRRAAPISNAKEVFYDVSKLMENSKCKHEYTHTTDLRLVITTKATAPGSYRDIDKTIAKLKGLKSDDETLSKDFTDFIRDKTTDVKNKVCILILNGGFGELNVPVYDPTFHYLIEENDVMIARLMIPGGGELGRLWQKKGKLHNKPQFLLKIKMTEDLLKNFADKIVLYGRHNGGLIAASVSVRIPFNRHGIIAEEPIIDLFDINRKIEGDRLVSEYGNAQMCYNDFQSIKEYEPYYIIDKDKINIPILVTCSILEDIFHYRHAVKFVARILENASYNKPAIFIAYDIPAREPKSLGDILNRKTDQVVFIIDHIYNEFKKPTENLNQESQN